MRDWLRGTLCCALLSVFACGDDSDDKDTSAKDGGQDQDGDGDSGASDAGEPAFSSPTYSQDENWLCRPGASTSRCKDPAESTEVGTDNALSPVAAPAKVTNKTDCFYVYPSVDVTSPAGRVKDFANIEDIWTVARTQGALFGHLCSVYAPLYHQATINSYNDPTVRDSLLEEAYGEVDDAFNHYLAQYNKGRDIILIGHSQGSHMLRRLMQKHFDGAEGETLRKQLSLAILLGPLGDVTVPKGALVGGSFRSIPICQSAEERACVVTYSSYPANMPPNATFGLAVGGIPEGREAPCTNPAAMAGGKAKSAGAYFLSTPVGTYAGATIDFKSMLQVKTDLTVYRNMYSLECKKNDAGQPYLAVTVEQASGAARKDPIQYDAPGLALSLLGLHVLDYNLGLDDLAALIKKHVEAK
jgi:hypothetical protein